MDGERVPQGCSGVEEGALEVRQEGKTRKRERGIMDVEESLPRIFFDSKDGRER